MAQYYYAVPLAAFIADLGVLVFLLAQLSRRAQGRSAGEDTGDQGASDRATGLRAFSRRIARGLAFFYTGLAGWNLGLVFVYGAPDAASARTALYCMHHVQFFLPWAFVLLAADISAREASAWTRFFFVATLVVLVAENLSYWNGDGWFVREMRRFDWGYYPLAGPLGALYFLLTAGGATVGFYFLLRPVRILYARAYRRLTLIFVLFWIAGASNLIPVTGLPLFPVGNAVDTVLALFVLKILMGAAAPAGGLYQVGRVLSALSGAVLAAWFMLAWAPLPGAAANLIAASLLASLATLGLFLATGQAANETVEQPFTPLFVRLQREYRLTYQEARICCELQAGRTRAELSARLNVAPGTLKNHLLSIYRKTLHREGQGESREQLQRLTVFLHRLAET